MIEAEWLASEDPAAMLQSLRCEWDKGGTYCIVSDRKLRLFATATWLYLFRPNRRINPTALEPTEVASWRLTVESAEASYRHADDPSQPLLDRIEWLALPAEEAAREAATQGSWIREWTRPDGANVAGLLRDVVGSPFSEAMRVGRWLTPTVLSLAQAAYDESNADGTLDRVRFAILADALEEAGCDSEEMLRHLRGWQRPTPTDRHHADCWVQFRGCAPDCPKDRAEREPWAPLPGPHVRGCWVLDLILGKQ